MAATRPFIFFVMAANAYVNIDEETRFNAWLKSVTDDFRKLTSAQRFNVLFRLTETCSPRELYDYVNSVTCFLHRDFISHLPAEVVDNVLSYLDYQSLLRACCVGITAYIKTLISWDFITRLCPKTRVDETTWGLAVFGVV